MTCPHLEETSALFDGHAHEAARIHADGCAECTAFLADAASMRASLRDAAVLHLLPAAPLPAPPRRRARFAVPAFAIAAIVLVILWIARPRPDLDADGVFAGLDGGGRATITVKEATR